MKRIITLLAAFVFASFFVFCVEASDVGASVYQSVTEESFGNVTVVTTTDLSTGIIKVETKTIDEVTGGINNNITITNTITGEVSQYSEYIVPKKVGYIYVGDSRYQGLDLYTKLSSEDNTWVFAEVSKGYNWLNSTAINLVEEVEQSNPQITDWVEIYTLGINDMANRDKYAYWYKNRGLSHNVVLLSMNPIERHKSITNESICAFNDALKATGLIYINCYDYLLEQGFSTADGVHYDVATNKVINKFVKNQVKSMFE